MMESIPGVYLFGSLPVAALTSPSVGLLFTISPIIKPNILHHHLPLLGLLVRLCQGLP